MQGAATGALRHACCRSAVPRRSRSGALLSMIVRRLVMGLSTLAKLQQMFRLDLEQAALDGGRRDAAAIRGSPV